VCRLHAKETTGFDLYYNSPLRWDGRDEKGRPLSNGIYLARIEVNGSRIIKKIVIAR
jgi:hypothetical protein